MANENLVKIKQIDSSLSDLIRQISSGSTSALVANFLQTGQQSPHVLHITGGAQTVLTQVTFGVSPILPYSGNLNQGVNRQFISDQLSFLSSSLNQLSANAVNLSGAQTIAGTKTFNSVIINQGITGTSANFSSSVRVPNLQMSNSPHGMSAVNLNFFYNQGILFSSGDQAIAGQKEFSLPPFLASPATSTRQAVRFDQFSNSTGWLQQQINALNIGQITNGFGGVLSFNGQSGNIFALGRGGIKIIQNGPITYVSGEPITLSGTGTYLMQGDQGPMGPSINPRGMWDSGNVYSYLDYVTTPNGRHGYIASTGHLSTIDNQPGTGGVVPWTLYFSGAAAGARGPRGAWNFRGDFNSTESYLFNDAVYYNGSTFGFSGGSSSGSSSPTGEGWYIVAQSGTKGDTGPIGSITNNGTITGNYVSLSFFQEFFYTGVNLFEAFVSRDFSVTGYAIGCVESGRGPLHLSSGFFGDLVYSPLTGAFYQRDASNVKTYIGGFSLDSGEFYKVGEMNVPVVGAPIRIGLDIFSGLSGISQITYGLFGL